MCSNSICGKLMTLLVTLIVANWGASAAVADIYQWATWTSTGASTASAMTSGLETVKATASSTILNPVPWPIDFVGAPFTPLAAPSIALDDSAFSVIDFSGVANTSGMIVGIGNFANPSLFPWKYRLTAFDTANQPIPLTLLNQIGNFDHNWTGLGSFYNDDTSLDLGTGLFSVTAVLGGSDSDSDMFLFSLPENVLRLELSSDMPVAGDAVNVVLATSVPEPGSLVCGFLGLVGLLAIRRRRV